MKTELHITNIAPRFSANDGFPSWIRAKGVGKRIDLFQDGL
jgi:hypothetical protein